MNPTKEAIIRAVDELAPTLYDTNKYLYNHPETAYREILACDHLTKVLENFDFDVAVGVGGVTTAFVARPQGVQPMRPCVAILAEYDALPKIGHGCGHNLIAAAGIGAAVALKRTLNDAAGGVALVGTPAEEGGGGKVRLMEAGVFKGFDAAMMFHPSQSNLPGKGMLARTKFKMSFHGRSAHAANAPDQGINALDALILAYTGINALRQHLLGDARIHGIITNGGDAPNIIPDYAEAMFYVRAATNTYRDEVFDRICACAQSAAKALGARVEIQVVGPKLDPMRRNPALEAAFQANMKLLGVPIDIDSGRMGSSDIGNLSGYLPSIHPYLSIVDDNVPGHSTGFRDATLTNRGKTSMLNAAKLLAMTTYDFLTSSRLQKQVKEDFKKVS